MARGPRRKKPDGPWIRHKWTEDEVKTLRDLLELGCTNAEIASVFGCSPGNVTWAARNKAKWPARKRSNIRYTAKSKAEALRLRRLGYTVERTAKLVGVSWSAVQAWGVAAGIPSVRTQRSAKLKPIVLRLYARKVPVETIRSWTGVEPNTVTRWARGAGMPIRGRVEGPERARIRLLWLEGVPLREIERKTGRAATAIRNATKDLPRRPPGGLSRKPKISKADPRTRIAGPGELEAMAGGIL